MPKMILAKKYLTWDGALRRARFESGISKTHNYVPMRFRKDGTQLVQYEPIRPGDYWRIGKVRKDYGKDK